MLMMNYQQKVNLVEMKYADPFGYLNMNSSSPSTTRGRDEDAGGKGGGQELRQLLVGNLQK